jgi:hypothetical protein
MRGVLRFIVASPAFPLFAALATGLPVAMLIARIAA